MPVALGMSLSKFRVERSNNSVTNRFAPSSSDRDRTILPCSETCPRLARVEIPGRLIETNDEGGNLCLKTGNSGKYRVGMAEKKTFNETDGYGDGTTSAQADKQRTSPVAETGKKHLSDEPNTQQRGNEQHRHPPRPIARSGSGEQQNHATARHCKWNHQSQCQNSAIGLQPDFMHRWVSGYQISIPKRRAISAIALSIAPRYACGYAFCNPKTAAMTHEHSPGGSSPKLVVSGITILIVLYALACTFGWPQQATDLKASKGGTHATDEPSGHDHPQGHEGEVAAENNFQQEDHSRDVRSPRFFWVMPFVLLLLGIAVLPLIPATTGWWESNAHRFYLAAGLGLVTLLYYLVGHGGPIHAHWPSHAIIQPVPDQIFQWNLSWNVFANAILHEFIPFIVLLFSLYTISGGIRIEGNLAAHPLTNTTFIAVGGLLASFIGTTGAAMLLIRPLLETNKERKHTVHTVVFFIFVVCNCGGCLLPIGDPPLFLGYLRGVDFLWTMTLWKQWLLVNCILLVIYWVWDQMFSYPRETIQDTQRDETQKRTLRIQGWLIGVPLLLGVVFSVALLDPSKPIAGTSWHAPFYLREIVQLALVGLSLFLSKSIIRQKNAFSYHAILEVAALFFGIFICMQPALQILDAKGPEMGVNTPAKFFWATGGLSSVLDNAPTYVVFFETARTLNPSPTPLPETVIDPDFLIAISLGAVFMGAMTYIGNGPNFMVKAIAETAGVRMPSFFGYLKYSCLILLPVLFIVSSFFL